MGAGNELTGEGALTGSVCNETEKLFRVPDAVGNLYRRPDRQGRTYGAGGRLLETENAKYHYDAAGNLGAKVVDNSKTWLYKWNANGSLREVERPDRRTVCFEYDALGRRTAKTFDGKVTRWVWDGNTPLHEWTYDEQYRPKVVTDEYGLKHTEGTEPVDNITTWVFEEGSFRPAAKLTEDKKYSIITDYLGTPVQMYDEKGEKNWEARLDIYGKVANFVGSSLSDCPFRYQGQYEDAEAGLYYNRFRYYSPEEGMYLSKDPIGLMGGDKLYAYVHDPSTWIDPFGLSRRGNQATRDHIEVVKNKFMADNPGATHIGGGLDGAGKQMKEVYIPPKNKIPGSTKGSSYADLTFKTADGKTVHINTVDKGSFNGMSNRELTNLNRIKDDAPDAKVIAVGKGDNPGDLSMNKTPKTSCH
jgi:RHS repeat-associated protein